jgi:alkylation response protein AidB-like acyl-CoA dehydrogenase
MFQMMNEARIGVGMGAIMLGYAGYLYSLDYARNRPQGRQPDGKDPSSPQISIVEHADVRRMLLTQKAYVEGAFDLGLYAARLFDDTHTLETAEERTRALELLDLLTPIVKSWPSEFCLKANELAIQILVATAIPANTRWSSTTATTASTRSTRAPMASSRSTCSAARSRRMWRRAQAVAQADQRLLPARQRV